MGTTFYFTFQRRAAFLTAVTLLTLTVIFSYPSLTAPYLYKCYIRRELERPGPTWIPLGDGVLHDLSVGAIWGAFLLLGLGLPGRRESLRSLFYAAGWFQGTYWLLDALKGALGDVRCGGPRPTYPNGISGHYCYFTFVSLGAPVLATAIYARLPPADRARPANRALLAAAGALVAAYAAGSLATLFRTYAHGYHSPAQIMLGTALGCLSHVALDVLHFSDAVLKGRGPARERIELSILAAKIVLVLVLYHLLWPVQTAGPAITPVQYIFHAALWAVILSTSTSLRPKQRAVA